MSRCIRARVVGALLVVAGVGLRAAPLAAQVPVNDSAVSAVRDDDRRGSAEIVLVGSLPPGARAVVQRGAGRRSRNLILVTGATSATELGAAIATLRRSRERRGEESDPQSIVIAAVRESPHGPPFDHRRRLQDYLDRLHASQGGDVEGVGTVRSIVIPLSAVRR